MASSSTAASTSYANNNYYVYDIFINHRGPDCKKTFATDLYNRLCKHGLRVFLDVEELQEGDRLTSQIEGAIGTASVHIAIFSPRYAESEWCLNELVLMLESKATILPVFYGVKPSDLRWTQGENGVYARALRMLQGKKTCDSQSGQEKPRYEPVTIEKWRKALYDAADISGFEIENYNGDERQVEQVVAGVLKKVKRKLHVSKYPIALDEKVEHFERKMLLQQQSGQTRVIGIVGLGGVGKTTLAKEIFNRQISNYKESCFLSDVRDTPLNSLNFLQNMLLKKLARFNEHINNTDEGIEMLRRYLSSSKALIILDDVDHIEQMNALLLPAKDVLHSGSLILVTSRNKDVLTSSGIEESSIYKLTGLDRQHSEELFCLHAFQQSNPVVGFEKVVNEFLDACDGLPLSLMVLGAHLHGKSDLKYWEAQLRKISKALPTDIQRRLKISYDGLDEEEKHIFLDIACFFIGEDRDTAIRIWDGSGWEGKLGFRNLENKCIVEVDGKNQITMNDNLRVLGRDLAEKEPPDCRRRLWRPDDNLINLSNQSPVRGISMKNSPKWPLQSTAMRSLQLIRAEGHSVESIFSVAQTPQLIWLCWNNCPYPYLPSWTPMENLRVLQIKGIEFETIWREDSQAPLLLRELEIVGPLSHIPKSIGKLKHLERIVIGSINGNSPLVLLTKFPEEFCLLQSLKALVLRGCSKMKTLPECFGKLSNLQQIQLIQCSVLKSLPDSLGNLTNLQQIQLIECRALEELPDSFGNLTNLQQIQHNLRSLDLRGCFSLQILPDSVGNLRNLQSLDLSRCSSLQMLPDSVGNLRNLRSLDLRGCSSLQLLPDSVESLWNLQSIYLRGCFNLQMLPNHFGKLTGLQHIDLSGCSKLPMLPNSFRTLKNLRHIDLSRCSNLGMLPYSFGNLRNLKHINLSDCSNLQMLPNSLENLKQLQYMDLSRCSNLHTLPNSFGNLRNLQHINLSDCSNLQMLPNSFGNLTNLQHIDLSGCSNLPILPNSFGNLIQLKHLCLRKCYDLIISSETLGQIRTLEWLKISGCYGIEVLPPQITHQRFLRELYLFCPFLKELSSAIGELSHLEILHLSSSCLEQLEIGSLVSLEELRACKCVTLKSIQGLAKLTKLRRLEVSNCSELKELPDVEHLMSVEELSASECPKLQWGSGVREQLDRQLKKCIIG